MEYTNAHSPKWANKERTVLDLMVTFEGIGEVPFSATADDSTDHCRELFGKAVNLEFGVVADYTAPILTPEETIAELTAAVQSHLDAKAIERNYDNILSACSYATSTNPKFKAEGQACVEWRDAVWSTCYIHMDMVLSGQAPIPSAEDLIALLPVMVWPA